MESDAATTDQRLARGAKTRRAITRRAVDVASMEGLNGLSIGRLATDLGLSKSGVQTLFGTKEQLQLASIECARELFTETVIQPALTADHGVARLRALVERWLVYAETPLFPGGCFWVANYADFDSRPGLVRDTLFRQQARWRGLLADELRHTKEGKNSTELDPDLAAFQIDAALCAANIGLRINDKDIVSKTRRTIEHILQPADRTFSR
jgi:AcrR family transcriptional regulator